MRLNGRWFNFAMTAALALALCACDQTPEGLDDDVVEPTPATQPQASTPRPAGEFGSTLESLQKRAEAGELSAMMALARSYEALSGENNKAEAKKWYEKAAAAGDESAREALRMMDAQAAATTRAAAEAAAEAERMGASALASTQPADASAGASSSTPPSTARAVNLAGVTWQEILDSFDNSDFVTVSRPGYRKNPTDTPVFVGLTTAPDKTFTLAASGPEGNRLDAVSIVLRVRNRQNIDRNSRVLQAAAVTKTVTRGNIDNKEMVDWVQNFLMTGAGSEPAFRNGWSITVGGTSGVGLPDPKKHLGEAVLIELKK